MLNALTRILDPVAGGRRIMMVAVGAGSLAVFWAVAQWAMSPTMVPLFSSLPVESVGEMTQRLDEEDLEYEIQAGGSTLAVAEKDLARARVALAQVGFPAGGKPGWELFDEASWGMTDFTQRVNYRRALEGELWRLERAWEEAEEIAAIADKLLLPRNAEEWIKLQETKD